jgi:hypothetical protein
MLRIALHLQLRAPGAEELLPLDHFSRSSLTYLEIFECLDKLDERSARSHGFVGLSERKLDVGLE